MAVYLNTVKHPYIAADTLDEINRFARLLGLSIMWQKVTKDGLPYYSLSKEQAENAIKKGALDAKEHYIAWEEMIHNWKQSRGQKAL